MCIIVLSKPSKVASIIRETVTSVYPLFYIKSGFFLCIKRNVLESPNSQTLLHTLVK